MTTNLKYAKSITSFYIKYFRTTTVQYADREMLTDLIIRAKARLTDSELDAIEYVRFEREYAEWCKKYEINYVIEPEEEND